MNWRRLSRLLVIALAVFGGIALAAVVLIALCGPTLSTQRLVAFFTTMFAVTGAAVTVAVLVVTDRG